MAAVSAIVVPINVKVNVEDQENCAACEEKADGCDFHQGFNLGWDLCATMMKTFIDNGLE